MKTHSYIVKGNVYFGVRIFYKLIIQHNFFNMIRKQQHLIKKYIIDLN